MLKSRNIFPPGGWKFRQPETDWAAPPHLSFDDTVKAIQRHRLANPRHNLKTQREQIEAELENYTIARIKNMPGAAQYLVDGEQVIPKSLPLRNPAAGVVAGAKKFVSNSVAGASLWARWFGDGSTVNRETAERRAVICLACPGHRQNPNFAQRFSQAVARELQAVFGALKEQRLETAYDESLGVCDICDCPMKAKVWAPLPLIESELKPETRSKLPGGCWIIQKL